MLRDYPLISSVEEMCEIRGCSVDDLTDARREYAERKIPQNVVKLKNKLKTDLMKQAKEKNAELFTISKLTTLIKKITNLQTLKIFEIMIMDIGIL